MSRPEKSGRETGTGKPAFHLAPGDSAATVESRWTPEEAEAVRKALYEAMVRQTMLDAAYEERYGEERWDGSL